VQGKFKCTENSFVGSWKKVIASWGEMNSHYVNEFHDLPAWYVENANTSMLSAAAWKCGHPSMCEPNVNKRKFTGRPGRPKEYVGRLDMEIYIDGNWMWLEAKKRHFNLSNLGRKKSESSERLAKLIEYARNEARGSTKDAESAGWDVAALSFFSASILEDARERSDDATDRRGMGKEAACRIAVDEELGAMIDGVRAYEASLGQRVELAIFRNEDTRLQSWKGSDFPAAFGVAMSRF
jgi:hypothetical protein